MASLTSANGASHELSCQTPSVYLVQILQFGRQVVSNHFHGFERRLVEVRRLPIHHLYDHDTQRPDIHLETARREGQQVEELVTSSLAGTAFTWGCVCPQGKMWVVETPVVVGPSTEAALSTLSGVYMYVDRFFHCNSVTTVQDAVMKLWRLSSKMSVVWPMSTEYSCNNVVMTTGYSQ